MWQASKNSDQRVTLLMGVHEGAAHLPAQLRSIAAQHHKNWNLICSDDGSTDTSGSLLTKFARDHPGQVQTKNGPQQGFSANYMHMIQHLPSNIGLVGFADQDDIWTPEKISRAVDALGGCAGAPALYCGRRWDWVPKTGKTRATRTPDHPCSFRNALIENVAFGNTILLNPAAAQLARAAARRTGRVFAHDWWLYLLITGTGGQVFFDDGPPWLLYRQHAQNVLGAGWGIRSQMRRKRAVLRGVFADRVTLNVKAMEDVRDLLTPDARATLAAFDTARSQPLVPRLTGLRQVAPYRQTRMSTYGFWGAASLGRV
jgi:glycosyltransferase involved in cell wall biosynthesis